MAPTSPRPTSPRPTSSRPKTPKSRSIESQFHTETPPVIQIELPEEVNRRKVELPVQWSILDHATQKYTHLLQEYNIAEILKAIVEQIQSQNKRHKIKSIPAGIFPMAGNLDLNDPELGFHSLIVELEKRRPSPTLETTLETKTASIVNYLLTGKHPKNEKQFEGWKRTFSAGKRKGLWMGILSVDIPKEKSPDSYVCGGTQHYVAFVYIKSTHEVILFDSASKNPIQDQTEVYFILKHTFQALFAKSTPPTFRIIPFQHVLQLGAGDRTTEDPYSYNNQNVFCHTWSLWFITVFYLLYKDTSTDARTESLQTIAKLAKKEEVLNLAMIKRYVQWLLPYIYDPEMVSPKFRVRPYELALKKGDQTTLNKIYESYLLSKEPMTGLSYIYLYRSKTFLPIETLASKGKLAIDLFEKIPLA